MRTIALACGMAAILVGAYVVGRWWFDAPAETASASASRRPATSPSPPRVVDGAARRGVQGALALPTPATAGDRVLEAMMTQHPAAMLMLREAVYHGLFRADGRLGRCRAAARSETACWVRFRCALRGQLMELQFEGLDCGTSPGQPGGPDPLLLACVREQLTMSDPIGIPREAADELGDYVGPLEVPWYMD